MERPNSWKQDQWEGLLAFLSKERVFLRPFSPIRTLPEETNNELMDFVQATMSLSFSETLLRIIDDKGLTDVEVYKKALVDRRVFSRLRTLSSYQPSRATAIRFCFALGLSDAQAITLLEKAGFCLSTTKQNDLVLLYCLAEGIHDIPTVNEALITLGLKQL